MKIGQGRISKMFEDFIKGDYKGYTFASNEVDKQWCDQQIIKHNPSIASLVGKVVNLGGVAEGGNKRFSYVAILPTK